MIRQEICRFLSELVAIPSVNPGFSDAPERYTGENTLAEYLIHWAESRKIRCKKICAAPGRFCVLLEIGPDDAAPVMLSAHMDTVWTADMADPFVLKENGNFLCALGAVDDKGPLAAALIAMDRLNGKKLEYKFQLLASCDEEFGMCGIKKVIPGELRPALHIVSEPTSLKIVTAGKGSARFKVAVKGKKAHSSMPHLGENAISKAVKLIDVLQKYAFSLADRMPHPLLGNETLSIGTIRGGTQPSVVPDECEFSFNYRILPGHSPQILQAELEKILAETGIPFELSASFDADPVETPADNPLVRKMSAVLQKNALDPQLYGVPYASEAFQSAKNGIPVFLLGPGDINTAHTADECINIDEIEKMIRILEAFFTIPENNNQLP